jgi:hypothetical protein
MYSWSCECGEGGLGNNKFDAEDQGAAHMELAALEVIAGLDQATLLEVLRIGATNHPDRQAALELLVDHNHWLNSEHFRTGFITGFWDWVRGYWTFVAVIETKRAAEAADEKVLMGSTTQKAILRLAATIGGEYRASFSDEIQLLDPHEGALVLRAVTHALTAGGLRALSTL